MLKTIPLTVLSFLTGVGMLAAQISFSVPDIETCEATVSVPVTVTGFNNISAYSFSMEWDETILEFDSVGAFNLTHLDNADFGTAQASNGILTTAWIDNDGVGKSIANGTVIFRLYFTVLGMTGSSSTVTFENTPTPIIAAMGFPPVVLMVTTNDGSVTIGDSTPPVITCPADVSVNTPGSTAVVNGISATANDNCTPPVLTYNTTGATSLSGMGSASGQTFNVGLTTVTYTATDAENNVNSCSFDVTVTQVMNAVFFTASDDVANCEDTTISIAITVANFDNITAFSFSLLWDETIIDYASLTNTGILQHLNGGDFGLAQTGNGILTVAWVDDDGSGETLMDGDTIFIINYDVVGVPSDTSAIEFSDLPTDIIAASGFPPVAQNVITEDGIAAIVDDPPVLTGCPSNITGNNDPGICGAVITWVAPTATDDCDNPDPVPVQVEGLPSGSTFPVGKDTIVYIVTDSQGQTDTCSFVLEVMDVEAPVAVCPASIADVELDASGNGALPANIGDGSSTDNCSSITETSPSLNFTCADIGLQMVILTATDANGNTDTETCSFNVVDNLNPAALCQDVTIYLTSTGSGTVNASTIGMGSTDNCSTPSLSLDITDFNCNDIGPNTVVLTATDASNNSDTCHATVIVLDTIIPVAICPASIPNVELDANGNGVLPADIGDGSSTDNCSVTETSPLLSFSCADLGPQTVTLTATDVSNNSDTATCSFTVVDIIAPDAICPASIPNVMLDANGNGTLPANIGDGSSTDNCTVASETSPMLSFTCTDLGPQTVILTATDDSGNVGTEACAFNVIDTIAPVAVCPATIPDVVLDANGNGTLPANIGDGSSTDNCSVVSETSPMLSFTCADLGPQTVILTATDGNGNTDTETCAFNVVETTGPVAVCPASIPDVVLDASGNGTLPANIGDGSSTDNCSAVSETSPMLSFTCADLGPQTVILTATDGNGNTDTEACAFNVIDNIAPVAVCPASIPDVVLDANGNGTLPANLGDGSSTDNCSVIETSPTLNFTCTDLGPQTVILTATDGSGNTETEACAFNVIDNTAPVAVCPATILDVELDASGNGTLLANIGDGSSTDNCDVTETSPTLNFTCADLGPQMVVLTASDGSGNVDTAHCSFEVVDILNPVAICPASIPAVILDADGNGTLMANIGDGSSTDNCSSVIESSPLINVTCADLGPQTVVLTATDGNGTVDTAHCTFNVVDNLDPTITCPADLVAPAIDDCEAILSNYASLATVDDNCTLPANILIIQFPDSGTVINVTTIVSLTATDESGNSASCSFNVSIEDVDGPTLVCPAAQNIIADANCEGEILDYTGLATVSDNCSDTANILLSQNLAVGTVINSDTMVVLTAEDEAGNISTCTFEITVLDTFPPDITCPADQMANAVSNCSISLADYTGMATVSDNCSLAANISVTQSPIAGSNVTNNATVTLTAEDEDGNTASCTFEVTVVDTTGPSIVCPPTQTITDTICNGTLGDYISLANVSDNCSLPANISVVQDPAAGTAVDSSITVTLTAEDEAGNTSTCTFEVVVSDTTAPVISCPADIVDTADLGHCNTVVTWAMPTATDNCDTSVVVTCNPAPGSPFPVGTTTVICIAVDNAGNQDTCEFVVTIHDQEPPSLTCQGDTIITVPAGTVDTVVNGLGLAGFADNCAVDTVYYVLTGATTGTGSGSVVMSGTSFNLNTTTVTFIVVDESGNSDTCSFDVIVEEQTPLAIDCPANLNFNNTPGQCNTTIFSGLAPTISPLNILDSYYYELSGATTGDGQGSADGETFQVGFTTVTYFAVSTLGDTVSCSFIVQVNDTEPPIFSNCPNSPQTVGNTAGLCGANFIGNLVPTATENCPGMSITYVPTLGSLIPVGTNTVSVTAQDASGNIATCVYTLVVNDTEAPTIAGCNPLVNNPILVNADPDQCGAIVNWVEPTATDNCTLIAFTPSQGPGTSFNVGVTPVEYVAVDAVGNVSKCQFTVTVVDNQPPVFQNCPSNLMVNTAVGECEAIVNWSQATVSDNCGVVAFSCTDVSGTTFPVGTHTVSCGAVDAAGNTTVCSFAITVVDNELPNIFNIPSDTIVDNTPGLCGANVTWLEPTAADNCGIEDFNSTFAPGSFFPIGQTVVQYVAIDVNGNVEIESFTITVQDSTAPVFTCPDNITLTAAGEIISGPTNVIINFVSIDCEKIQLDFDLPAFTDDCGPVTIVQTEGPAPNEVFGTGSNTLTFLATDGNGNQSTCSFDVNVLSIDNAVADASPLTPCEGEDVFFFVNQYPNATYTWFDPQDNIISDQATFTLSGVALNGSGTYRVEIQLPFNCDVQALVDLVVSPNPTPEINHNDLLCTDGSMPLNLTAADASNAGVVEWIWEFPNGAFAFGQNQTINNATSANAGIYVVTATTANGCIGVDSVNVPISSEPMMPALFGTSTTACVGEEVVLNGQQLNGGSVVYNWYAEPAAGAGLISINNNVVSVNPTAAGIYRYYYYVVVDSCSSDTAEWVINVEAAPVLNIVTDGQTTCVDGTSSITLTEMGGEAVDWTWAGPCLPGLVNGSSVEINNVVASCSGIYTVVGTTMNGCTNLQEIQLDITNQPPAATLGVSQDSICTGSSATLAATPNYGPNATFIWTGQNLPVNASTLQSFSVTPGSAGVYPYSFAAVVNGCTTNVATVEILVEDTPPVNVTAEGNVACVDGTGTVILHSNAPDASSWTWTNSAGTILSLDSVLVLNNVTASATGTYFVAANSAIGCTSNGFYQLTVTEDLPAIEAILEQEPCEDGELEFSATTIPGAIYEWTNPTGNVFSNVQSPTIFNASSAQDGLYTVKVSLNGCTATDDTLVTVIAAPIAVDELVVGLVNTPQSFNVIVNDTLASNDFTITVIDQPDHGSVFLDSSQSAGVLTYIPNSLYRGTDRLLYEICYTDCPELCDVALVTLNIVYPGDTCVITTVITPNNDGINDEFNISCLEVDEYPLNELIIFNQWGDKVYEAAPYKNDWKGTWNGKDLPDGTYYFIFQRDPDVAAQKGFVMIYR